MPLRSRGGRGLSGLEAASRAPARQARPHARAGLGPDGRARGPRFLKAWEGTRPAAARSEEHTSELQSLTNLVCRLLLEKKKKKNTHKCRQSTNAQTMTTATLTTI